MGSPILFVVLLPFVFLAWGEIYALFSAITGDVFGSRNASGNYGILYTAKGLASILAGYGAALVAAHYAGSFQVPYYISSAFDITAAFLALFVLRPIIRRRIGKEGIATAGLSTAAPSTPFGSVVSPAHMGRN
jgi:OFA family oxalate/formate antiporter-like MFS transporter